MRKEASLHGLQFTSAKVVCNKGIPKGTVTFVAIVPQGKGVWPALWLLPIGTAVENGPSLPPSNWPRTGEIDVMELRGDMPNKLFQTIHFGTSWDTGHDMVRSCYNVENIADGQPHTFMATWDSTGMQMFVDGVCNLNIDFTQTNVWPSNCQLNDPASWPSVAATDSVNHISTRCNPFVKGVSFVPILNVAVGGQFFNPQPSQDSIPSKATMKITEVTLSPNTSFVKTCAAPTPC